MGLGGGLMVQPLLQVDGSDRQSQQFTREGWGPRGGGMKPICPDAQRAEEAEQGQQVPQDCSS
ncbi:hypothetical protein HPG69_009104 [Diceros bicornis minor]|uniref:Uncharacterized protein n=1 Tax=Diceros bicornis minor TaxID=77932 RepID=A0A7J7F1F8_DICBM|nr:hypothetical protein HPG69_009104 [Diceros bicornis minor]